MNKNPKYEFPELEWNAAPDWAIPLPSFPVEGDVVERHFIPDEAPVIPTGWIYRLRNREELSEYRLWCRRNPS